MAFKGTLQRFDGKGAMSIMMSACGEGYELRSRLHLKLWPAVLNAPRTGTAPASRNGTCQDLASGGKFAYFIFFYKNCSLENGFRKTSLRFKISWKPFPFLGISNNKSV